MARKREIVRSYEVCPYDGTHLRPGDPCPKCEEDIQAHLQECWRCAGDYADMRRRDEAAE